MEQEWTDYSRDDLLVYFFIYFLFIFYLYLTRIINVQFAKIKYETSFLHKTLRG